MTNENYIKELENTVKQMLSPFKNLPFIEKCMVMKVI